MGILESYEINNISLLESIILLEKSWRQVTAATIRNCFRHKCLLKNVLELRNRVAKNEEEDLSIAIWLEQHGVIIFTKDEIGHIGSSDNEVCTSDDIPIDDDIASEVKQKNDDDEVASLTFRRGK